MGLFFNRADQRPGGGRFTAPAGSLTAAATRVATTRGPSGQSPVETRSWQHQAWDYLDDVGELSYVCSWLANSLSQVELYAAEVDAHGRPADHPTNNETAASIVGDIAGGPAGQAALLAKLAIGLTVPGEAWIAVITRDDESGYYTRPREEWHVLSSDEISPLPGGGLELRLPDGDTHTFNDDMDLLTRLHRPHPRYGGEPWSPVRAALPVLKEIVQATQTIEAAARSRLAGNGILMVPSELEMPTTTGPSVDDTIGLDGQDSYTGEMVSSGTLMDELQQVMEMAISDRASAAALVPIVLTGPGEQLDNITHLKLDSDVPEIALRTRDASIHRLALSLDIPPEILTGVSESNHWSAWQIDDAAIKTHIRPMMTLICDALTDAVLAPLLEEEGLNPEQFTVWYDASALAQKPNRGEDAVAAFDRGAISKETLRRELGFSDDDQVDLSSDEAQRDLMWEIVKQAPSMLPALAEHLGIEVDVGRLPRRAPEDLDHSDGGGVPDGPMADPGRNPAPGGDNQ